MLLEWIFCWHDLLLCWFQWASKHNCLHLSSLAPPAGGIVCYSMLYSLSLPELHSFFIAYSNVVVKYSDLKKKKTDAFSCNKLLSNLRSTWFCHIMVPLRPQYPPIFYFIFFNGVTITIAHTYY